MKMTFTVSVAFKCSAPESNFYGALSIWHVIFRASFLLRPTDYVVTLQLH